MLEKRRGETDANYPRKNAKIVEEKHENSAIIDKNDTITTNQSNPKSNEKGSSFDAYSSESSNGNPSNNYSDSDDMFADNFVIKKEVRKRLKVK
jgi:hypothetical protein